MPKIRGVKPELWTDENFVELSPFARLLWIGLWNHACDNGHLQDKSKQIKMRILPTDEVNCAELLREIEGQRLIERVDGWIIIPNLSHHQKPHRRWWSTCDKPGCVLPEGASHAPSNRGATVAPPKRNRVATADVDGDVESDGDGESDLNPSRASRSEMDPEGFAEFWGIYGKKVGRKNAVAKYRLALKKPGVTADLLVAAARSYVDWQRSEGKFPAYTKDPATWLNGEHWTDERSARVAPQPHTGRAAQWMQLAADLGPEQPSNVREIGPRR